MNLPKYNTKEKNLIKSLDSKLVIATEDSDEVIPISDIYIPEQFRKTKVKWYKLKRVLKYYNEFGTLDEAVTVIAELNEIGSRNRFILVDGYSRYVVAHKFFDMKYIPVKYIDINTYCNEMNI